MQGDRDFVPFEQVEHTADLAYVVRGRTLEELFENAALGLMSFLVDPESVAARERERIEVEGDDAEGCLIAWLQEILYREEVRHRLYRRFQVREVRPPLVSAIAEGEDLDPRRHQLLAGIKAATYHDLRIHREDSPVGPLLAVRIVLDT